MIEGNHVNITCPYSYGNPEETMVLWLNASNDILSDDIFLYLNNVTRREAGLYKCVAGNEMVPSSGVSKMGEDETEFHVNVLCKHTCSLQ